MSLDRLVLSDSNIHAYGLAMAQSNFICQTQELRQLGSQSGFRRADINETQTAPYSPLPRQGRNFLKYLTVFKWFSVDLWLVELKPKLHIARRRLHLSN